MANFGNYEIQKRVEQTQLLTTYIGLDTVNNRPVMLKVPHPQWVENRRFAEYFQQDGARAMSLHHPRIAKTYEVGMVNGNLFVASEYLKGISLRQIIEKRSYLMVDQALVLLNQIATAVDFAHQQGMMHGYLNPDAVTLVSGPEKGMKVSDFGLARPLQLLSEMTSDSYTPEALQHMAPEQLNEARAEEIGPEADRYSLGILTYYMLAGRFPFSVRDTAALAVSSDKESLPIPLNGHIPEVLCFPLSKMLTNAPANRFGSCVAFVEALRHVMESVETIEAPAKAGEPTAAGSSAPKESLALAELYKQLKSAVDNRAWLTAELVGEKIKRQDPHYRDVAQILAEAEAKQKQETLSNLYIDVQTAVRQEEWFTVQQLGQEILEIDPDYKDVAQVVALAEQQLNTPRAAVAAAEPAAESETSGRHWSWWLVGGTVTVATVLIMACAVLFIFVRANLSRAQEELAQLESTLEGNSGVAQVEAAADDSTATAVSSSTAAQLPAEGYTDYITVADESRVISVEVPTTWADVISVQDDVDGIPFYTLLAAPNGDALASSFLTPGVMVVAVPNLSGTQMNDFLSLYDYSAQCIYGGVSAYDDGVYSGEFDLWLECGGTPTKIYVLAAEPSDAAAAVIVITQVVTAADEEARQRIWNTFFIQ